MPRSSYTSRGSNAIETVIVGQVFHIATTIGLVGRVRGPEVCYAGGITIGGGGRTSEELDSKGRKFVRTTRLYWHVVALRYIGSLLDGGTRRRNIWPVTTET